MSEQQTTQMSSTNSAGKDESRRRTVILHLNCAGQAKVIPDEKYEEAIGYLSIWGLGSSTITQVRIYGDTDGNLDAVYSNEKGETIFQIGAIWRMQHSGKHKSQMGYDFNS